jgi:N-acetylmuramic acid 6-phosphate etherase
LTAAQITALMNAEDSRVAEAVRSELPCVAEAVELIEARLRDGGRLIYVGAGTSGRLGVLDAAECPPTFSTPPGMVLGLIAGGEPALTRAVEAAEDSREAGREDLEAVNVGPKDVVVGITASGVTPYVLGALAKAGQCGAATVGLTCGTTDLLADLVAIVIAPRVGPEVIAGSTRLKAGTAQKMVLNMLSTAAMVRLGKVYGNLMVDVRPTNRKLRSRARRIVGEVTGLAGAEAERLLEQCGWEVKTALVTRLAGLAPEEARERLSRAGGRVAEALAEGSA